MLTSKERADLRAMATNIDTTLMVGKSGVTETVIAEAENLLTARELVKGKVLEGANDALLGGALLDGRPDEVRQARDLPALDVDTVLEEGLALGLEGRVREAVGDVGGQDLAVGGDRRPAVLLGVVELLGEVGREDVSAQAHGDPLLAVDLEAIDGGVVDLVLLGLADGGEQPGYLLRGVVLLGDYKLQPGTGFLLLWNVLQRRGRRTPVDDVTLYTIGACRRQSKVA
jgi:hypothetical protein